MRITKFFLAVFIASAAEPIYRDPSQPAEKRIDDLLSRMTLAEKVGQLNMPCVYEEGLGRGIAAKTEAVQKFAAGTYTTDIGPGGGFFTLANEILPNGSKQQAEFFNKLQKIAIESPRLGRNQEGYSEDPYLCSRIAYNIVRGAQGAGLSSQEAVVSGLCHYPGQSQPVSGLERGAMEISERMLREVFLPPWVAGIKKAGARGVMATY